MSDFGEYQVTGRREYRGHDPGDTFIDRLDRGAEKRAIYRGDIRLIRRVTPSIDPRFLTFPAGWLDDPPSKGPTPRPPRRREAPQSLRRE